MNQEDIKKMIVRLRHIYADGDPITEEAADMLESLSNQLAECQRDIADLNEVRQNDIDEFNRVNTELAALKAEMTKLSEQEPLGWQGHSWHLVYDKKSLLPSTRHLAKPIYLHPAPSVSEGYQLVPIEPTEAMQEAWDGESSLMGTWNAMLAAARSDRELQHEHTMKQFQEVCNGRNCYSSKARPAHSEECKADHDACYAAARSE